MQKGDIVRIFKQPTDLGPQIKGTVGFIENIVGKYAAIQALRLNGESDGGGSVPLSCLQLETDPMWLRAKKAYDRRMDVLYNEYEKRTKCYKKVLRHVAKKYNISKKKAEKIHKALDSWEEYYWENLHGEQNTRLHK